MRYTHHAQQWLPHPVERVFDFFSDPANLPRLMPTWQAARIEDSAIISPPPASASRKLSTPSVSGATAGAGTRMTITFRPIPFVPIRIPWDAEITEFAWDDHFCDIQLRRGPFAYWRHCHRLEASLQDGRPGTLLRDEITYELPLGIIGDLANALFVARQMNSLFRYRQQQTAALMERSSS